MHGFSKFLNGGYRNWENLPNLTHGRWIDFIGTRPAVMLFQNASDLPVLEAFWGRSNAVAVISGFGQTFPPYASNVTLIESNQIM